MNIPNNAGAATAPWLQPASSTPISQMWPGVLYPWMVPTPWGQPGCLPNSICLGAQCWPRKGMTLFTANHIAEVLRQRSWPSQTAATAAVALYEAGFYQQARGIMTVYGGRDGVEAFARQMRAVYDPCP